VHIRRHTLFIETEPPALDQAVASDIQYLGNRGLQGRRSLRYEEANEVVPAAKAIAHRLGDRALSGDGSESGLGDARIEIGSNIVERASRPIALN
jgi:hypothetical protein